MAASHRETSATSNGMRMYAEVLTLYRLASMSVTIHVLYVDVGFRLVREATNE